MPGFGSSPFGKGPFGSWPWSKAVLFDNLSEFDKEADPAQGDPLRKWSQAVGSLLDDSRKKIADFGDLRDPLKVRTQYDENYRLRLGLKRPKHSDIEQKGAEGSVLAGGQFTAPNLRVGLQDIGKEIAVKGSSISSNNQVVTISSIVDYKTVLTTPALTVDSGPLHYELRPVTPHDPLVSTVQIRGGDVFGIKPDHLLTDGYHEFTVQAKRQFPQVVRIKELLTDKEAQDGFIDSQGRFGSANVLIERKDIGKILTISGANDNDNNIRAEILDVDLTPVPLAVLSRLHVRGANSNGGINYALKPGKTGVRLEQINPGLNGSLSVSVTDLDISVTLATNGSGTITSTAANIVTALNADTQASALVTPVATGTGLGVAAAFPLTEIPGVTLTQESGPLNWTILNFAELEIKGHGTPRGLVEQEGSDLSVTGPNTLHSVSAQFLSSDIGKVIRIPSSTLGNAGVFAITAVNSANQVTIAETLTVENDLTWELHTASNLEDLDQTQVIVRAPSLINYLAQDYGIEIDTQESEIRQRRWAGTVPLWADKKGHAESYEIIGKISGFDVYLKKLYHISQDLSNIIPGTNLYEVGEGEEGRYGLDGTLLSVSGVLVFFSLTALFRSTDVGRSVRISGAASGGNNKLFEIHTVVDDTTVWIRPVDAIGTTTPDANNGSLSWAVVTLFTDIAPTLPRFDEVNPDLMQSIVGVNAFKLDQFCWQAGSDETINITVTVVTNLSSGLYEITATGDCDVALRVGQWSLNYAGLAPLWLETVPENIAPNTFKFNILSPSTPALGAAELAYNCPEQTLCSLFCASWTLLAKIQTGDIVSESILAKEKALDRVLTRLKNEVTPAHVRLVPVLSQVVQATLVLSATVET